LAIEEVRFADRLDVRVDVTEQARAVRVPRLILQPLVENAVRHGIGAKAGAGRIEITGRTSERELIVMVRDDGPGPSSSPPGNGGVGLRNTRERLTTAYGAAARLTLEHAPGGGALATLVIPVRFDVGAQQAAPLPTNGNLK
jgi:LytS/YehU family sensor histidine kinase